MQEYLDKIKNFFSVYPEYFYLMIAVLMTIYGIGNLLKKIGHYSSVLVDNAQIIML